MTNNEAKQEIIKQLLVKTEGLFIDPKLSVAFAMAIQKSLDAFEGFLEAKNRKGDSEDG